MPDIITWTNEVRKLSDLIPWPRNPRQITPEQSERLQESLAEFGQPEVITIGPDNSVYNGHQRLKSWGDKLGDIEIDVRISSRLLTEKEREKLTVFLHKGAAGEWDFDTLANEFDVDDLLDWGFDKHDLDLDLWGVEEPEDDPGAQIDRAEELRELWGVETGQLWQLGEHRLICGDSTERSTFEQLINEQLAEMIMTSPPYWVGKEYENEQSWDEVLDFIATVSELMAAYTIKRGRIVINTGTAQIGRFHKHAEMSLLLDEWQRALRPYEWLLRHPRVWAKSGGLGGLVGPKSDVVDIHWEFIATFYHPHKPFNGQRRVGDTSWPNQGIWNDIQGNANQTGHIASFPIEIPERNILLYSDEGQMILDPFLGSGTTLIACERLGRKCRAVEISPAYCAVAIQRWADMTGGEPELIK